MDFKIILFFTLLTGTLLINTSAYADTSKITCESATLACSDAPNSTIVMHDEVLRTDSGNSNNPVTKIQVYDAGQKLVHTESNCNSSKCSTSFKSLSAGTYFVKVSTKNGSTFTGYVDLK